MAVSLQKGQRVSLTKDNEGLTKVIVGLGWNTNKYSGGYDFDLDASAFMVGIRGKVPSDSHFIFYNNMESPDGSLLHTGDDRVGGDGSSDDEQLILDLTKVAANVDKISFAITIHDAEARCQNFGQISNAFVRIVNEETGVELLRYDLGEEYSVETAVIVGELYRDGSEWRFSAIGSGFQGGLSSLCGNFGIMV